MSDLHPAPPAFTVTGPADEFVVGAGLSWYQRLAHRLLRRNFGPCALCDDRPLQLGDVGMKVPTDQGEKLHHAICFYDVRARGLEDVLEQTKGELRSAHQMLCAAAAGNAGRLNLTMTHFQEAERQKWKLEISKSEDGTVRVRLAGQLVTLADATAMKPRLVK